MKKTIATLLLVFFIALFLTSYVEAAIKINEIYPAPETGEFEWVEIYNDENKEIDISGYYLTDNTTISSHKLKFNINNIAAFGYAIATASGNPGVLNNNDGDSAILRNAVGEIIENINYSGSFDPQKSYIRCPNGGTDWFMSTNITKNSSNDIACVALTPTVTPNPTPTATPTPDPTNTPAPTKTPAPTPTLTPTKIPSPTLKLLTPTIFLTSITKPTSINQLIEVTPEEKVLGIKSDNSKNLSLLKLLLLVPFAFSLLTIVSILLKIKKG